MDYKKLFFVFLFVSAVLLGTSTYLYLDNSSQNALISELTSERDAAQEQEQVANDKLKKLQNRQRRMADSSKNDNDADKLSKVIDEKDAEITRLKRRQQENQDRENRRGGRGGMEEMRQRMERMKTEDPERYEQMMSNMEKRRKEMEERQEKRDQYVKNIDTSKLSYDQQQVVANYQNLLKAQAEQRANMQSGNVDFREMMDTNRQIGQLSTQIRDILIDQYAGSAAEEIKNIINATSNNGPGGFGGGPGGFGGGPAGGFGGGQR